MQHSGSKKLLHTFTPVIFQDKVTAVIMKTTQGALDNPNRPVWMKNDKVKNMTELNIVQVFIIGPWLSTNSARVNLRNFWNLTQLQNICKLGTPKMCQSKDV